MSIKKQYLKGKSICKVTFKIDEPDGDAAEKAWVVGDFNNWSKSATPMKRLKNGQFTTTLSLEKGRQYQFRYLLGHNDWQNDEDADDSVPTPFGDSSNSVLVL